jgi:hypothetical protein
MKPSFRRIGLYIAKTYPPWVTLPYSGLSYIALSWTLLKGSGRTPALDLGTLAGTLTTFFFLLFLRVSDELKDAESDKRFFPERLFPSGRVTSPDLRCLWWVALVALAASVALIWPPSPWSVLLIAYALLMFKYFFAPKAISGNLLLALVTHNPSMYLLQLCALGFISPRRMPTGLDLLICLLFYLPALLWEISRKVRSPSRETAYRTYSSIFGYRLAALIAFAPAAFCAALALFLAPRLGISLWALSAIGSILAAYALRIAVFVTKPEMKLPTVGDTAQAWGLSFYAIVVADAASHAWI